MTAKKKAQSKKKSTAKKKASAKKQASSTHNHYGHTVSDSHIEVKPEVKISAEHLNSVDTIAGALKANAEGLKSLASALAFEQAPDINVTAMRFEAATPNND